MKLPPVLNRLQYDQYPATSLPYMITCGKKAVFSCSFYIFPILLKIDFHYVNLFKVLIGE